MSKGIAGCKRAVLCRGPSFGTRVDPAAKSQTATSPGGVCPTCYPTYLSFLDSERSVPREAIVPPCAENRRGFSRSLTPRKGHFSSSPWHRHGKTVPKKESALKGHPNMPGPSERVASSWGAPAGLNVLKRINPTALPWAASGLPLVGFKRSMGEAYSQTPGGRGCGSPSHTTRALALSQSNRFVNKPATSSFPSK